MRNKYSNKSHHALYICSVHTRICGIEKAANPGSRRELCCLEYLDVERFNKTFGKGSFSSCKERFASPNQFD